MNFIGACPELIESFDVTVEIPQVNEGTYYSEGVLASDSFYLSRGIWAVTCTRIPHDWDGHSHGFPIYEQQFSVKIFGDYIPGIGDYWMTGGWPCASITNAYFTTESVVVGYPTAPNTRHCVGAFAMNLGCPFCVGTVGGELRVGFGTAAAYANYYAFGVRAQGMRIG